MKRSIEPHQRNEDNALQLSKRHNIEFKQSSQSINLSSVEQPTSIMYSRISDNYNGKQVSNPFSTGGGGIYFEQKVQAYFLSLFLFDGIFPIVGSAKCSKIMLQARRHGFQTDDMVVFLQANNQIGHKLLIQIKHKITFTESDEPTQETLKQAWIDFKNPDPIIFDRKTDRIVLISGMLSQLSIEHLIPIFEWARQSENEKDFISRFKSNANEKKKKIDTIRHIINQAFKITISDPELWQFIKILDVLSYDFDVMNGKDETNILNQIKATLIEQTDENAQQVWNCVLKIIANANPNSSVITRENLPTELICKFMKKNVQAFFWHVPSFDEQNFLGNQNLLDSVLQRLNNNKQEQIVVPIFGLGGIGKTYLALKLSSMLLSNYSRILWFNAKSQKFLEEQFFDFAQEFDIFLENSLSITAKLEKIKNWFINNQNFLLIFDDAQSHAMVKTFLPKVGHIIITSLNSIGWTNGIQVNTMDNNDATQLLKQEAGLLSDNTQDKEIEILVKSLGNLPLAIAQAGAYINATGVSAAEYIKYYNARKKLMLENTILEEKRNEHLPVYVTLELSIEKVGEAKDLLVYCSYLNPNNIPKTLFTNADIDTKLKLDREIILLKKYSLIKSSQDHIGVHCVVQDVVREKISFDELHDEWIIKTIVLLNEHFIYNYGDKEALTNVKLIIPHMIKAKELASVINHSITCAYKEQLGKLLQNLGMFYLEHLYDSETAEEYFKLAEPLLQERSVLLKQNDQYLFKAYSRNHKLEQIAQYIPKLKSAADIDSLCLLGNYYLQLNYRKTANDLKSAKTYFESALKLAQTNVDKIKLAMVYHYMGTMFSFDGDAKLRLAKPLKKFSKVSVSPGQQIMINRKKIEAENLFHNSLSYYQKSLKLKEQIYDKTHLEIARTKQQIGVVCIKSHDYQSAEKYLTEAIKSFKAFYKDEPREEVAYLLRYLADIYLKLNLLDKAESLIKQNLLHLEELPCLCKKNKNFKKKIEQQFKYVKSFSQNNMQCSALLVTQIQSVINDKDTINCNQNLVGDEYHSTDHHYKQSMSGEQTIRTINRNVVCLYDEQISFYVDEVKILAGCVGIEITNNAFLRELINNFTRDNDCSVFDPRSVAVRAMKKQEKHLFRLSYFKHIERFLAILSRGLAKNNNTVVFDLNEELQKDLALLSQNIAQDQRIQDRETSQIVKGDQKSYSILDRIINGHVELISRAEQLQIDDVRDILNSFGIQLGQWISTNVTGDKIAVLTPDIEQFLDDTLKQISLSHEQGGLGANTYDIFIVPTSVGIRGGHWVCYVCKETENGKFEKQRIDPSEFQKDSFSCGYWTIALVIEALANNGVKFNETDQIVAFLNEQKNGLYTSLQLMDFCLQTLLNHNGIEQKGWPDFLKCSQLTTKQLAKINEETETDQASASESSAKSGIVQNLQRPTILNAYNLQSQSFIVGLQPEIVKPTNIQKKPTLITSVARK